MRTLFIFLYKFKIFKRLVPSIIRRFYSKKKLFIQLENFKIFLDVESSIDREIYLKGYYDKEKIKPERMFRNFLNSVENMNNYKEKSE